MKKIQLDNKHADYDGDIYLKYQCLYEGGRKFKDNINLFLDKNPMEDLSQYSRRCKIANYQSHVNTLVNQFCANLFSNQIEVRSKDEVELPEYYDSFKENCDLRGTDLLNMTKDIFLECLVKGVSWVKVCKPDGQEVQSKLEYDELELGKCWVEKVSPEDVYSFAVDNFDGSLKWLRTHSCKCNDDNPFGPTDLTTETWTTYTKDTVYIHQITYDSKHIPNNETEVPLVDEYLHGFNVVPFIPLQAPTGLWLTDKLASTQISHFILDNSLLWQLNSTAFPISVFKCNDDSQIQVSESGYGVRIGQDEELSWISPGSDSSTVMQAKVSSLKDEMYRLASLMALSVDAASGAALGRSAESKGKDNEATEIILFSYGAIVKEFLERLYNLISAIRGEDIRFSIEGMDQFDMDETEAITNAVMISKEMVIPSETFNRELAYKFAMVVLPNVDESVKQTIKDEIFISSKLDDDSPLEKSIDNMDNSESNNDNNQSNSVDGQEE